MKNKTQDNNYPWYKYYKDVRKHLEYPDVSMYEMVKRTALKYPSNIAYNFYGNKITYKTFLKQIDVSACAFIRMGVKKGDYVSIIMPNTPEAIISIYALNKLGAICNMIHPLNSEEEMKYAINLTKSKYVIVCDIVFNKIKNIRKNIKTVEKILYIPLSESMDPITSFIYKITKARKIHLPTFDDVIPYYRFISRAKFHKSEVKDTSLGSDVAIILHSGGTTGKSKGIVLTNRNLNALALSELEIIKTMTPGSSCLSIMPIFHGFGLGCTIHGVYLGGGQTIILPTVNPKKFSDIILKYKPNAIACVPSMLEGLHKNKKLQDADLSFINCLVCGGDMINDKLVKKLNEFLYDHGSNATVRCAYGMTECTAGVTMMPLEINKPNSIGIPIPDTIIKIVRPNTIEELDYGIEGEICISGPTVMNEYLNEKEETKNILKKHKDGNIYLHSGDLGYMDKDGFVYFKSRIKRMIVSSGYNIYPNTIENIILEHPYVESCAVVGVPHPYKKEVIKAYIVLKKGIVLNNEVKRSIKEHCEKNIASYALPYAYGYRKELPKTLIGKVAYKELISDEGEEIEEK